MDLLSKIALLLVEDNDTDALAFKATLANVGEVTFTICVAHSIMEAEEKLKSQAYDIVLLDLFLPDSIFLNGLNHLINQYPDTPVIVYTGIYSREMASRCIRAGAQDYIVKQYTDADDLARRILHSVERHRAQRKVATLTEAQRE